MIHGSKTVCHKSGIRQGYLLKYFINLKRCRICNIQYCTIAIAEPFDGDPFSFFSIHMLIL